MSLPYTASRTELSSPDNLMLVHDEADVLVVAKLDRLSRTTRHLLEVVDQAERCGFGFLAVDTDVDSTTPAGRLVVTMMAGVAEWERRVIGERTKAALAVKKAQGPASADRSPPRNRSGSG